jgi:Kef-type K+ transport system membrane component KefB
VSHADWIVTVAIGDVALVLAVGTVFVVIARRLRQPAVIGEIAAGICLGPSVLGLFPGHLPDHLFPAEIRSYMNVVAQIGLLLFMFLIGWEFDYRSMRGRRRATGTIWVTAAAVPLALGMGLAALLYHSHDTVNGKHIDMLDFCLYLGVAMSIAAFPVLARIITDHRLHLSRVGTLALALAALDDILAWSMLAIVVALVTASGTSGFLSVLGWGVVFVLVSVFIVRPLLAYAAKYIDKNTTPYLALLTAAGALGSAYVTQTIGLHAIFGAFVFGLIMPRGPRKAQELLNSSATIPMENAAKIIMPLFFVVTGLSVNVTTLKASDVLIMFAIIAVAITGKLGSVLLATRLTGMSWQDSTIMGLLMNTRGLTELVILNIGLDIGLLGVPLFSTMVVMALVTTGMTSPFLSMMLKRAKQDSQTRISQPAQPLTLAPDSADTRHSA